jgi:hypothetical protein
LVGYKVSPLRSLERSFKSREPSPSVAYRGFVAVAVGISACALLLLTRHFIPDARTDFSALWNGARLIWRGENPYELIGPGRAIPYANPLHYPASSLVAVFPLIWLREAAADLVFVFFSAALLAFGATKDNWNRIWMFPSAAFIIAARAGQMTPLIAAGYFLPYAAAFLPIKPSTGLAVIATWSSRRAWYAAGGVALVTTIVAFLVQPNWVHDWLQLTLSSGEYVSPVRRLGGFLLLLAALRWRQREGRLLLCLALIPQVASWYAALLPLLVARTKSECQILSLTSSTGYLLMMPLAMMNPTGEIAIPTVGNMMIAFCYLPALIVVLHQNEIDSP